jgi:FixJ family two-component response regulator
MTPLTQTAARIAGLADRELATTLGVSSHTAQAYRLGRRVEYLTAIQRRALLQRVRLELDRHEADYQQMIRS